MSACWCPAAAPQCRRNGKREEVGKAEGGRGEAIDTHTCMGMGIVFSICDGIIVGVVVVVVLLLLSS